MVLQIILADILLIARKLSARISCKTIEYGVYIQFNDFKLKPRKK